MTLLSALPRSALGFVALALLVGASGAVRGQSHPASSEAGIPIMQSFGVRDYEEHNQNWAAVQDAAGVLYVGNKDVVLAYDGQSWESIHTGGSFIRCLAVDAADRIWIGGVDEFGYLEADGLGGRRYISLGEHLPKGMADPLNFFQLKVTSHGVYLITDDLVLRWHEEKLGTIAEGGIRGWLEGDELLDICAGEDAQCGPVPPHPALGYDPVRGELLDS